MLSIGKITAGNERYYLDSVADGTEDYYTGNGEAPGTWHGTGAEQAGLSGAVEPEDFTAVIGGKTPSGTTLRAATSRVKVDGYDLTFSAPKSVSLLYAVANPAVARAARDAHDHAVQEALGYLEREASYVRRGMTGRNVLPASGVIAAAFRHRSSRAGDPQLHTHTVVANAGFADGRWSALDGRRLFAHAKTAGFLYQAVLRGQLTDELGVQWNPVERGMAEIAGVPDDVLDHFSQRSHELEQHLNQLGRSSRRSRELSALESRKRKDYAVSPDRLYEQWRARAAEFGFDAESVTALLDRPAAGQLSRHDLAAAAARFAGAAGVTESVSVFDRRDILRAWAQEHRAGASIAQIERLADQWLHEGEVVPLPASRRPTLAGRRYSTRDMLETERSLIETSHRRRGDGVAIARGEEVADSLRSRPTLTDEQSVVVRSLTQSGDGVQVVRAAAGTGKTFALDAAREAWEESGVPVTGCALSARAAVELQSQSGIRSQTAARLERELAHGRGIPKGGVLVVDEAGMVGTRQLARLARATEQANAKLVLLGDDRQLPEIDAGGAFRGIAERVGSLRLKTVKRQTNDWDRKALDDLRNGRVEEWATAYRDNGRIVAHTTAETSRRALVGDWWVAAREPGTDAVMIAHRRADVADLNHRARQLMLEDRRLGADEVTLGDRSFAAGDLVLAKRNDPRLDIVNGTRGEVVDVDIERRAITVQTTSGDHVDLDARYLDAGHLEHGYALTAHAAQGATVDKSYVLGSDDLYREWGYTALSRHRDEARYYTVSSGRPESVLPGLEPEPDPLLLDISDELQGSRRKDLAIDALSDDAALEAEQPAGTFADLRVNERELRRARDEAARIAERLADAELRCGALEAELEATPRRKVSARAALRETIERHQVVIDDWQARADVSLTEIDGLRTRGALLDDSLGIEPEAPGVPNQAAAPEMELEPEMDLGL